MSARRFDDFETDLESFIDSDDISFTESPTNKLERRRRIEELFEEKRLREDLGEFDYEFDEVNL